MEGLAQSNNVMQFIAWAIGLIGVVLTIIIVATVYILLTRLNK